MRDKAFQPGVNPKTMRSVIAKAKMRLTDTQFRYFQDKYEFGWDMRTIAAFHDVTHQTVSATLNRAIRRMENVFKP